MKKINKPWGHELIWAHTDNYVGKKVFISKGNRLSLQYHEKKEESIYVIFGTLLLELDGDNESRKSTVRLGIGDSYHLPSNTVHRMIAPEDVILIEVSTTELNDVVRLADDYGRAGIEDSEDYEDELPTDIDNEIPFKPPSKP